MSTATRAVQGNEIPVGVQGSFGSAQAFSPASRLEANTADAYDMTPLTRKIVAITLISGVVFLAAVGAYVWYGTAQWLAMQ